MQRALALGSLVVALVLLVVGIVLARQEARRWQGYWSLMAAGVLLIETYAAPVCVGT